MDPPGHSRRADRSTSPMGTLEKQHSTMDTLARPTHLNGGYFELSAMDPPEEHHQPGNHSATLHQAYRGPTAELEVLPADRDSEHMPHNIFLVRDFGTNGEPTQGYALTEGYQPIDLSHGKRHPEWGCVFFGIVCERVGPRSFQVTSQRVAIKRLNRLIVHEYLNRGGQENPYKEAARMEELGDGRHVLPLIEFLEDDNYLYIVTPEATGTHRTLSDAIAWGDPSAVMEPERAQQIFSKILKILHYLASKGISHRDLSPSNFLFLTDENLVVFDLAMSVKIPVDQISGKWCLINPNGRCGTLSFMAPEVFADKPFDGGAIDLWSAASIFYSILTNQILYKAPCANDVSFNFFICARNLSTNPCNEKAMAMLDALDETNIKKLSIHSLAHTYINDEALSLLEHLLAIEPDQRYTLAQAMESSYCALGY